MTPDWIGIAEQASELGHAGHLTILRFTTGWKAVFGTYSEHDRGVVSTFRTCPTAQEACRDLLLRDSYLTWEQVAAAEADDDTPGLFWGAE